MPLQLQGVNVMVWLKSRSGGIRPSFAAVDQDVGMTACQHGSATKPSGQSRWRHVGVTTLQGSKLVRQTRQTTKKGNLSHQQGSVAVLDARQAGLAFKELREGYHGCMNLKLVSLLQAFRVLSCMTAEMLKTSRTRMSMDAGASNRKSNNRKYTVQLPPADKSYPSPMMQRYLQEKDPYKELLARPTGKPARDERKREEQPSNKRPNGGSGGRQ
ncbi:hypothetical protein Q9189_006483 [Teloschistes chrysophthalmus]